MSPGKQLTTRSDLNEVWRQTAHDHGFGPDEAVRLIGASERPATERAIGQLRHATRIAGAAINAWLSQSRFAH